MEQWYAAGAVDVQRGGVGGHGPQPLTMGARVWATPAPASSIAGFLASTNLGAGRIRHGLQRRATRLTAQALARPRHLEELEATLPGAKVDQIVWRRCCAIRFEIARPERHSLPANGRQDAWRRVRATMDAPRSGTRQMSGVVRRRFQRVDRTRHIPSSLQWTPVLRIRKRIWRGFYRWVS